MRKLTVDWLAGESSAVCVLRYHGMAMVTDYWWHLPFYLCYNTYTKLPIATLKSVQLLLLCLCLGVQSIQCGVDVCQQCIS